MGDRGHLAGGEGDLQGRHGVRLYFRFPPGLGHVDEILATRGIRISHETVRPWPRSDFKLGRQISFASVTNLQFRTGRRNTIAINWIQRRGRWTTFLQSRRRLFTPPAVELNIVVSQTRSRPANVSGVDCSKASKLFRPL